MKTGKYIILIIVGVAMMTIARQWGKEAGQSKAMGENKNTTPSEVTQSTSDKKLIWDTTQVGNTNLYFASPFPVKTFKVFVKEELKGELVEMVTYKLDFPNNLENTVGYFKFKEGNQFNLKNGLDGALDGAFKDITATGRTADFKVIKKSLTISGSPAERADVTFKLDKEEMYGLFLFLGEEKKYTWNFVFLLKKKDIKNKQIIDKIISSINIVQ